MSDKLFGPLPLITAGDMSSTITSSAIDIRSFDNIGIQLVWTGTPTGTFSVTVSNDGTTYKALTLSPTVSAAGSASNDIIDLNALPFAYMKVVYTASSGSGSLTCKVMAKAN